MVHILFVKLNKSVKFNFLRELIGGILCVSLLFMFSNTSYAASSTLNVGQSKSYVLTYPITTYNSYLDDYGNMYSTVTVTGNINNGNGFSSSVPCTVSLILNTSQGDFPIYYNDSTTTNATAGRSLTVSGVPTGLTLYVTQYNTGSSSVTVSTPSFSPSVSATVYSLDDDDIDLSTIVSNQNTSNGYLSGIQTKLNLIDNHINLIMQDTGAIKATCDSIFVDVHNIANGVYVINSNIEDIENIVRGNLGNGYDLVSFNIDSFSVGFPSAVPIKVGLFDKILHFSSSDYGSSDYNLYFSRGIFSGSAEYQRYVPCVLSTSGTYSFYCILKSDIVISPTSYNFRLYGNDYTVVNLTSPSASYSFLNNGLYYNVFRFDVSPTYSFDGVYLSMGSSSYLRNWHISDGYFCLARQNGSISDLMDLMEKQWEGSYNVPSDTTAAITNLDGSLGSVDATEQSYFEGYDSAYNNAGIPDWNLSVLGTEFSFVQATVNLFYNGLPSTIRFLIVSVLIIGIFGVILNTLGRIKDK